MRRWTVIGGHVVLCGFLTLTAVLVIAHVSGLPGALLIAGIIPIVAVFVGFGLNSITDRLPWLLVAMGLSLLTVVNGRWFILADVLGQTEVDNLYSRILQMAGYAFLLSASIVVVLRHTPQNSGAIIDAALIGMGAAGIIWEMVLRPRLLELGTQSTGQTVQLVQSFILLACAGALGRISWSTERARPSLNYLFVSLGLTILGLILSVTLTSPDGSRQSVLVPMCWLIGYSSLAAAALHPSARAFTQPSAAYTEELSPWRLALLGAVLLVPGVGGTLPYFLGSEADMLLLAVGPLLIVPLVLTRIGQLIAQRARDQRALAFQAHHDELTGLKNRRALFDQAGQVLHRLANGNCGEVALLYGDLDGFKPINDRYGHEAGDFVLRAVARRLAETVRADDVVGRIGGDEFLVLCPGASGADAVGLRYRIERAVAAPIEWNGWVLFIGITVGIIHAEAGANPTPHQLFAAADEQMYQLKRQKKEAALRY